MNLSAYVTLPVKPENGDLAASQIPDSLNFGPAMRECVKLPSTPAKITVGVPASVARMKSSGPVDASCTEPPNKACMALVPDSTTVI